MSRIDGPPISRPLSRPGLPANPVLLSWLLWAALPATGWAGSAIRLDNPVVEDVPAAFARIGESTARLGVWTHGIIGYPFYSLNPEHDFGDNHFQGIQRLRAGGGYLVISGDNIARRGDLTRLGLPQPAGVQAMEEPHGDLVIARLVSRPAQGAWGSNVDGRTGLPAARDRALLDLRISIPLPSGTRLWHPGGISAVGDVLVVPVENYSAKWGDVRSQILFYDVADPEHPRLFPHRIDRTVPPVTDKAGAATMVRLPDGRFLVASRTTTHLSFYLSLSTRFADGFEPRPTAVLDERNVRTAPGLNPGKFKGSSIHLLKQADGRLFLIDLTERNVKPKPGGAPQGAPQEVASLWRVEFPRGDYRAVPVLTRIADRIFGEQTLGDGGWGNFGAAAGIYLTDAGEIAIYTAARWQTDRAGHPTVKDFTAGDYIRPADAVFIPMSELWPR